jgi:hypothetical protein
MKPINAVIIVLLALSALSASPPETVILKDGRPLGQMMVENDVYVRPVGDVCLHEGSLFLSDMRKGQILQIDVQSGRLIRAISSLGQGPAELQRPTRLVVRNGKVFVIDQGYFGIKIFTTAGVFLGSFKLRSYYATDKSFDVNDRNEIFVPQENPEEKTLVSVYSLNGKRLRGLVHGKLEQKNELEYLSQHEYNLRLDCKGNLYLLFNLERKVKKYDPQGKLLWEEKIANKLLDKYPHDDKAYVNPRGGLNIRTRIHDLEIDDLCRVFIVHAGGGSVLDENGNTLFLLLNQNPDFPTLTHSLHYVSISRGYLLNQTSFSTEDLRLYQIK